MKRIVLTLTIIAIASAALSQPFKDHYSPATSPTPDPVAQLRWVDQADPKADLRRNIEKHDTRFLVFNGISSNMRPGLASDTRVAKHGTRLLEGTTEAPINEEHARLVLKAVKYAGEYNDLLLDYLKSHE
jgi:hypothetical protein